MCFVLLTVQNRHEAFRSPDSLRKAFLLSRFSFRLHMPDGNQTDVRFLPPGNNQRDRREDLLHVRRVPFFFHVLFPSCSLLILCYLLSSNGFTLLSCIPPIIAIMRNRSSFDILLSSVPPPSVGSAKMRCFWTKASMKKSTSSFHKSR